MLLWGRKGSEEEEKKEPEFYETRASGDFWSWFNLWNCYYLSFNTMLAINNVRFLWVSILRMEETPDLPVLTQPSHSSAREAAYGPLPSSPLMQSILAVAMGCLGLVRFWCLFVTGWLSLVRLWCLFFSVKTPNNAVMPQSSTVRIMQFIDQPWTRLY